MTKKVKEKKVKAPKLAKLCPNCKVIKPCHHFAKSKCRPDGLQVWCRQCFSDRYGRYRKETW